MAEGRSYDEFAHDFERQDRPAVLDVLGDVKDRKVLDLGCGPGLYAEELARRGADVLGVDNSPQMVRLAEERLRGRATFQVRNLDRPMWWLAPASFDLAVMALVIHHLDDRRAALREVRRVLRSGGRLVVSTHHPVADWLHLGGSYFDVRLVEETWTPDWTTRYWRLPVGVTCDEFADAGFVIERIVEPLPQPEMAQQFPGIQCELATTPAFIVYSLRKPIGRSLSV